MKVITTLNEKGGVGKTTVSIHIAAGLAIKGYRVLLIDADAQGNATQELNVEEYGGLYRLLGQDAQWGDVLREPVAATWAGEQDAKGSLWVVPSNIETRVIPMVTDNAMILRERLEDIEDSLDVVIVDTSPTPSMLHSIIYMATDYLIYPTKCESLSLEGLNKTIGHMEMLNGSRERAGLPHAALMGVQPTMYDPRTNAHDLGLEFVVKAFRRQTWPALPVRTVWRDRSWERKTLYAYAPEHVATDEAWAMVDRVEKGIKAS